jgi:hypothetical protein
VPERVVAKRVSARGTISNAKYLGDRDLTQAKSFQGGAVVVLCHAALIKHTRPRRNHPLVQMAIENNYLAAADKKEHTCRSHTLASRTCHRHQQACIPLHSSSRMVLVDFILRTGTGRPRGLDRFQRWAFRHPAAIASASLQNQRSPLRGSICVS